MAERWKPVWFDEMFRNLVLHVGDTRWQLTGKLSENSSKVPPCEARAVSIAKQIVGTCQGMEVIVKARMEYGYLGLIGITFN